MGLPDACPLQTTFDLPKSKAVLVRDFAVNWEVGFTYISREAPTIAGGSTAFYSRTKFARPCAVLLNYCGKIPGYRSSGTLPTRKRCGVTNCAATTAVS